MELLQQDGVQGQYEYVSDLRTASDSQPLTCFKAGWPALQPVKKWEARFIAGQVVNWAVAYVHKSRFTSK